MNQISIDKYIKINLGLMIQKHFKYFEYQLVMQKKEKDTVPPSGTSDKIPPKDI